MEGDICIGVREPSQTAEARRIAMHLASRLAFDEADAGNVGLVVTEAARNLLKHAGGGDVLIRGVHLDGTATVEIVAIDKGPGIADIGRSFQDGYSTTGTPGTGLGAISRASTYHEVYSQPNQGTALLTQIRRRDRNVPQRNRSSDGFRIGGVCLPKSGEPVCGDAWKWQELPTAARLVVADGLGHGLLAAEAARTSVRVVEEHAGEAGAGLMRRIHEALRPTRGAAVALAEIDSGQATLRYTGIGNISAHIYAPCGPARHLVSLAGTAGHEIRRISEFHYPWPSGSLLVMHSDGLTSHWSLDRYPGLASRHPSLIAAVLYRDFNRGRDDATVIVLQAQNNASHSDSSNRI